MFPNGTDLFAPSGRVKQSSRSNNNGADAPVFLVRDISDGSYPDSSYAVISPCVVGECMIPSHGIDLTIAVKSYGLPFPSDGCIDGALQKNADKIFFRDRPVADVAGTQTRIDFDHVSDRASPVILSYHDIGTDVAGEWSQRGGQLLSHLCHGRDKFR